MRIGLFGGTGDMGKGLALRWGKWHEMYIGSRSKERAESAANEYFQTIRSRGTASAKVVGLLNEEIVGLCEVLVFTVPYEPSMELATSLAKSFSDQVVISPLVPLRKENGLYVYSPRKGSAAEELRDTINGEVVSALHTVPARRLSSDETLPNSDVIVCGDSKDSKRVVMDLIRQIEPLRPMDGGPLRVSSLIESIVPLLLNVSKFSGIHEPTIQLR